MVTGGLWVWSGAASDRTVAKGFATEAGFTYVGLLMLVAVAGIGLAYIGTIWHTTIQREKEAELVFVGEQFQSAIRSYYERSPQAGKTFPKTLQDLLEDRRSGTVVRHLRRIFVDPMTGNTEWGLDKQSDGRLVGVHSLSSTLVFRTDGLPEGVQVKGDTHGDWHFMVSAGGKAPPGSGGAPSGQAPGVDGLNPSATPVIPPVTDVRPDEPPPNKCADQRREDMLKCFDLKDAARQKCENDSARTYATCVRDAARKG